MRLWCKAPPTALDVLPLFDFLIFTFRPIFRSSLAYNSDSIRVRLKPNRAVNTLERELRKEGEKSLMPNKFTQKAQNVLTRSLTLSRELGHTYVGSEHLLLSLLTEEDCIAARLLIAKGDVSGVASLCRRCFQLFGRNFTDDIISSVREEQSTPQPSSCKIFSRKGLGVALTAKYSLYPLFHEKAFCTRRAFSRMPFSS